MNLLSWVFPKREEKQKTLSRCVGELRGNPQVNATEAMFRNMSQETPNADDDQPKIDVSMADFYKEITK